MVIPYILFAEAYFFRHQRYFVVLERRIVGVFALREKVESLYVSSIAVSPFYRRMGMATYVLNYSALLAGQLHKMALELSVLKANAPALRLYGSFGFRKKEERRRSFVLRKTITPSGK